MCECVSVDVCFSPEVALLSFLQVAGTSVLTRVTDAGMNRLFAVLALYAHTQERRQMRDGTAKEKRSVRPQIEHRHRIKASPEQNNNKAVCVRVCVCV